MASAVQPKPSQAAAEKRRTRPRAARGGDAPAPSPALEAQARLAEAWLDAQPIPGRWSPRRTLLFLITTCGGFWILVIYGLSRLFR